MAVNTPTEGLDRLRAAADTGELAALCRCHGIRVLTVFGSTGRGDSAPNDLDVAVLTEPGADFDLLRARHDFEQLTGLYDDRFDFVHLNDLAPALRENALIGTIGLYEGIPGAQLEAGTAAAMERMDTEWLVRLNLRLLST